MTIYVGVTDNNWFRFLAERKPDEVNFWRPGGTQNFNVLKPGEMFLFKLHSPHNFIAGGGFFVRYSALPVSLAWEAFQEKNGVPDYISLLQTIRRYRSHNDRNPDPVIGCVILTLPFFFNREEWIAVPEDWSPNIVQGKSYSADSPIGRRLKAEVEERLHRHSQGFMQDMVYEQASENVYRSPQLIYRRLGQGAFRVIVTEAYQRRCAITGERTLPVLEAAHIKPFSQNGPHEPRNGLLLRKDLHALFDRGYLTVNSDELCIEVSNRIKEDYGNGRDYYAYHGKPLAVLPPNIYEQPSRVFLQWHNENVYLG